MTLACATADGDAPPDGAETGLQNTIRWTTASEVDNYGFEVYRADSEEGPYASLNPTPIPGAGTSDLPREYEYVDETIEPDAVYYYYVESISMSGERETITPVIRSLPKPTPAGSP